MQPNQWSTTYNAQYRDRRRYDAPPAGVSDLSFNQRTQAYYGTKASLSEHAARTSEDAVRSSYHERHDPSYSSNIQQSRTVDAQGNIVYNTNGNGNQSFSPSNYNNGGQTYNGTNGNFTGYPIGGSCNGPATCPTVRGNGTCCDDCSTNKTLCPTKDLWNTPIAPHSGIYSNYSNIPGGLNPKCLTGTSYMSSPTARANANATSPSAQSAYYTQQAETQRNNAYGGQQYGNGNGNNNGGEWQQNNHVPGYQGFIRGIQFQHGQTFGKTSADCLSIPTDVPLEP